MIDSYAHPVRGHLTCLSTKGIMSHLSLYLNLYDKRTKTKRGVSEWSDNQVDYYQEH